MCRHVPKVSGCFELTISGVYNFFLSTLRYDVASSGISHGDRWQIAKMDPIRPGLQGYGVQQNNPSKLW